MNHSTTDGSKSDTTLTFSDLLRVLFEPGDLIERRSFDANKSIDRKWRTYSEWIELGEEAAMFGKMADTHDHFFGGNPRSREGGSKEDVDLCRCVFADFDHTTVEDAVARIEAVKLPEPTAVVNSGHGVHAYWRLTEPMDPATFTTTQKRLAAGLGSDAKVCDSPRLMRIPGTRRIEKPGGAECVVVAIGGDRYDLSDLLDLLPEVGVEVGGDAASGRTQRSTADDTGRDTLMGLARAYIGKVPSVGEGERNAKAFQLAGHICAFTIHETGETLGEADVLTVVTAWNTFNTPPLPPTEVASAVASAFKGNGTPRPPKVATANGRGGRGGVTGNGNDSAANALQADDGAERVESSSERPPPMIDPTDPRPAARLLIEERYTTDDIRTLHYWRGDWWWWTGSRYAEAEQRTIRNAVGAFCEGAVQWVRRGDDHRLVPCKPNKSRIDNIIDALHQLTHLPAAVESPAWIGDAGGPDPLKLLPCLNGVLNLDDSKLLPHDPRLFNTGGLGYDFNADAGEPVQWLRFLDQLWRDDPESVETLRRWAGYLLTPDTSQQKALLLIGPKRSGKGTIARVLSHLIGTANVASPTLSSLTTNFGLWPLIGRQLATISDARLSGRADQAVVVERLLSITGEDFITVDRKNQVPLTLKLPTRFMLLANELPRLGDASGAIASRFIVLRLEQSFYGHEDHGLTERLLAELPAILLWAVGGWRALQERGRFDQPATAADLIDELSDLCSPISVFIRDRCLVQTGQQVDKAELFAAWRRWCDAEGRDHPGTKATFIRDVRASESGVRTRKLGARGDRRPVLEGISLLPSRGE